jgi:preprotein translocase subunit YajC
MNNKMAKKKQSNKGLKIILYVISIIIAFFILAQTRLFWRIIIITLDRIFWAFENIIKNWMFVGLILVTIGVIFYFFKKYKREINYGK